MLWRVPSRFPFWAIQLVAQLHIRSVTFSADRTPKLLPNAQALVPCRAHLSVSRSHEACV